ncbi:MAG: glycine cleavage system aminomethyltransferase GcvT [Prolixibacteraceae bacterium]|nr:glycine cleavage system aminomethyltransferase GcvT [Prolixibacteraceae bacterium]
MKKTLLNDIHRQNGGKMVDFAGFEMPLQFTTIKEEHMTVRQKVGVFDVSHMGEFWVKGSGAAELIQFVTTNDISVLKPGQAQYSCLPNGRGGIVDDLLVYFFEPEKYLLVVNAANIDKDWKWINSQNTFGAVLENSSDNISQLAIQGPKALSVLKKLTDVDLENIKYYYFTAGSFAEVDNVIISATGYTGAGGFEIYCYNEDLLKIYSAVIKAGEDFGISPVGLGARDSLRLEMGYCLYGNDIDDTTSPIEAGLGWITKFNDHNDFIDKSVLLAQKKAGVTRCLKGFKMIDRGIPRHGYELVDNDGNVIGRVTSGTQSFMLNKGIGMGYVNKEFYATGTELFVKARGKLLKAEIIKTPFV